jgi:hypothetical protein
MSRRAAQSSEVEITYTSRLDVTSEGELNALAAVYRFILDCRREKKGTRPGAPDDAEGRSNAGATQILSKQTHH